jgi:apolipoprotein N-acyltransferase
MFHLEHALNIAGFVIFIISAFFILVIAFQKSTTWGFAMLILGSLLWPIFILKNWSETKFWFFIALFGSLLQFVAH